MREFNSEPSTTVTALRGKRILITGASGFLGKVVLEKLLRSVPDVEAVYLLMRGNRHHRDARSRFEAEVATSSIFDTLRTERGEWFEQFCQQRLHCITGEVTEPRFGLSRAAFNTLAGEVDAVINSAASVNFREELDRALEINTLSLDNIVECTVMLANASDFPAMNTVYSTFFGAVKPTRAAAAMGVLGDGLVEIKCSGWAPTPAVEVAH